MCSKTDCRKIRIKAFKFDLEELNEQVDICSKCSLDFKENTFKSLRLLQLNKKLKERKADD